ncbi:MAG: sulfite exporter TauE/SafE family protein [Bacteroidia bacterium]|nr:sulfite exporter TauE/SafE family protein [Bacteroidia bacterium]
MTRRGNDVGTSVRTWAWLAAGLLVVLGGIWAVGWAFAGSDLDVRGTLWAQADGWFLLYLAAGFVAQVVDGAIGMGYGIFCNSILMATGLPPDSASASVHFTKVFTSGFSGLAHLRLRNVNPRLVWHLVIPGSIGAAVGVGVLSVLEPPFVVGLVACYLLVMGLLLVRKVFQRHIPRRGLKGLGFIGFAGGFLDALGGGGWGPVVTTSLLNRGRDPRYTIGSVSLTEFFVALTSSVAFFLVIELSYWKPILGLLVGGMLAAPLRALLTVRLPRRLLLGLTGLLIVGLSLRQLWRLV